MMPSPLHHIPTSSVSSEEVFSALSAPNNLIQKKQKSADNFHTVLYCFFACFGFPSTKTWISEMLEVTTLSTDIFMPHLAFFR